MNSGQRSKSVSTAQASRGGRGTSDAAAVSENGSAADTLLGAAGARQTPPSWSTSHSCGENALRGSLAGARQATHGAAPTGGKFGSPAAANAHAASHANRGAGIAPVYP